AARGAAGRSGSRPDEGEGPPAARLDPEMAAGSAEAAAGHEDAGVLLQRRAAALSRLGQADAGGQGGPADAERRRASLEGAGPSQPPGRVVALTRQCRPFGSASLLVSPRSLDAPAVVSTISLETGNGSSDDCWGTNSSVTPSTTSM